jgi:hypothetical protein
MQHADQIKVCQVPHNTKRDPADQYEGVDDEQRSLEIWNLEDTRKTAAVV